MIVLIAAVSLLIYSGLVGYIGWSGWSLIKPRTAGKPNILKYAYIGVLIVVSTSFILGQFTGNVLFTIAGAYWMAIFYLCILLLPLAQISSLLLRLTRVSRDRIRRSVGGALLLLLAGLIAYGSYQAYSPVVRTYELQIAKSAGALKELRIVMAADMHFGVLSGKAHAARLVREISALEPDLVLLPGDLLDDALDPFLQQGIDRILSGLEAPYGVYASLGNHDRINGPVQQIIDAVEATGIRVLHDESVVIADSLTLIGRQDRSRRGRAPLAELMQNVDHSKPVILLEHQPYELDEAREAGVDLMVSGHTHRGQVFPGNLITESIYENDWGHRRKGSLHSVVTSGYGFWGPPIRIGTRSEIVQINVTFE